MPCAEGTTAPNFCSTAGGGGVFVLPSADAVTCRAHPWCHLGPLASLSGRPLFSPSSHKILVNSRVTTAGVEAHIQSCFREHCHQIHVVGIHLQECEVGQMKVSCQKTGHKARLRSQSGSLQRRWVLRLNISMLLSAKPSLIPLCLFHSFEGFIVRLKQTTRNIPVKEQSNRNLAWNLNYFFPHFISTAPQSKTGGQKGDVISWMRSKNKRGESQGPQGCFATALHVHLTKRQPFLFL